MNILSPRIEHEIGPELLKVLADIHNKGLWFNDLRVNQWLFPEPDIHSHPWRGLDDKNDDFSYESYIISGWIYQHVYKRVDGKIVLVREERLEAGTSHKIRFDELHSILDVKFGTTTLLRTGRNYEGEITP